MRGHLRTAVVAALVGAFAAAATVAVAGTGVGGVFNLGQDNGVNATTDLHGSTAGAQLLVRNGSAAHGAYAVAANGVSADTPVISGANGGSGPGFRGQSVSGIGVIGQTGGASSAAGSFTNTGGGPAGSFTVNNGAAPFTVNSSTVVSRLNADSVDGYSGTSFAQKETVVWHYVGAPGEPVFENGWANYDTQADPNSATFQHVGFAEDQFGQVFLTGLAAGGTFGQVMFRLPADYCPYFFHTYPAVSNSAFARVTVTYISNGSCTVVPNTGSNLWVSLDGISFHWWVVERNHYGSFGAPNGPSTSRPPIDTLPAAQGAASP